MTEPLSEERLAEIRGRDDRIADEFDLDSIDPLLCAAVMDRAVLLVEVRRLSGENRVLQDRIEGVEALIEMCDDHHLSSLNVATLRELLSSAGE